MGEFDDKGGDSGRRLKLVRLIDEYEMENFGEELERKWVGRDDERWSLRELADLFNERLLASKMTAAGMQPLDGEVRNLCRLLTSEDASNADQTRARRRLERNGIDIDQLLTDFVTYQAVRTYLKDHREAKYSKSDTDRLKTELRSIQRLQGRTGSVTESKLAQLRENEHVALGPFRTLVDISVVCTECQSRYDVTELLKQEGCDCERNALSTE